MQPSGAVTNTNPSSTMRTSSSRLFAALQQYSSAVNVMIWAYLSVVSIFLCPSICMTWRMPLVLAYSVDTFHCLKIRVGALSQAHSGTGGPKPCQVDRADGLAPLDEPFDVGQVTSLVKGQLTVVDREVFRGDPRIMKPCLHMIPPLYRGQTKRTA